MGLFAVFARRSPICLCRYVLPVVAHSVALCGCAALPSVFVGLRWAVVVRGLLDGMPTPICTFSPRAVVTR